MASFSLKLDLDLSISVPEAPDIGIRDLLVSTPFSTLEWTAPLG